MRLPDLSPRTIDLPHGVTVKMRAVSRPAWRAARRAAAAAISEHPDNPEAMGDAISETLIMAGIEAWTGIEGDPPITTENVAAFLSDPDMFDQLDRDYVMPWIVRHQEGNASSGSPAGIGEPETRAKDTAPAAPKKKARNDVTHVPIAGSSRGQPKAKGSGKS